MGLKDYKKTGLGDQSWKVSGDNGTGKSTLEKALRWTLNASMSDDFKPQDSAGNEIPGLETSATISFTIDGEEMSFKRTAEDKNNKKTGEKQANDFKYFISGIEYKQSEYDAKIRELFNADKNMLKLLLPQHGFSTLDWKTLRIMLTELIPDKSDGDFLETSKWVNILGRIRGIGMDTAKKSLKNQVSTIEKKISDTKVLHQDIVDNLIEIQLPESNGTAALIDKKEDELRSLLSDSENVQTIAKKKAAITGLKSNIKEIEGTQTQALKEIAWRISAANQKKDEANAEIKNIEETIKGNVNLRDILVDNYKAANKPETILDTCPACGQKLLPEKVQETEIKNKQLKQKKLALIADKGFAMNTQIKKQETKLEERQEKIAEINIEINLLTKEELKQKENGIDQSVKELKQKIITEKTNISLLQTAQGNNEEAEILRNEIQTLKDQQAKEAIQTLEYKTYSKNKERIAELSNALKAFASELSTKSYLIDQITEASIAKYVAMEKQLNDQFTTVSIKLFDIPMQGEVKETCKIMVSGVEFGSGLNTAARANADLEIKKVFMEKISVACPIFIDNIESNTKPTEIKTQCFYLKVQEDKKELEWKAV